MRKIGARGVLAVAVLLGGTLTGCARGARQTAATPTPPPAASAKQAKIKGLQPGTIATPGPNELLLDTNADPLFGDAPLTVRFSAAPFDKRETRNPTYRWSFGDGSPDTTEPNPVHTYTKPGDYRATVTVSADGGKVGSEEFELSVDEPAED